MGRLKINLVKKINNLIWDFERFGYSPKKIFNRILNKSSIPIIFSNSIPKAGTHLVERLLCINPNIYRKFQPTLVESNINGNFEKILQNTKNNQLLVGHIQHSEKVSNLIKQYSCKQILTIRNPKDVLISRAHYISKNKNHFAYDLVKNVNTFEGKVRKCLYGDSENNFLSVKETFERFIKWKDDDVLVVKFEDLIGSRGLGNNNVQKKVIIDIFSYIDIELTKTELELYTNKIFFESSPTFRKGKIGSWKKKLSKSLINEINDELNEVSKKLNYKF